MPAKKKSQAAPTVKKISATRIAFRLRERYFSHEYINILGDASMREEYGVPKDVLAAYVVKLTIFRPSAPLAAIRAGAVPFDEAKKWTTTVPGANWAGHTKRMNTKRGPRNIKIGASEPDKTARHPRLPQGGHQRLWPRVHGRAGYPAGTADHRGGMGVRRRHDDCGR